MRLYIIRHGDPDYATDSLTPEGRQEAAALAERLAAMGLTHIYCSPLGRAKETMQYTAAQLPSLTPVTHGWMQELSALWMADSPWGPMAAWDVPGEALYADREQEVPAPESQRQDWDQLSIFESAGIDIAGALRELHAQSDLLLEQHGYRRHLELAGKYECLEPNEHAIAIFCHGGLGLTWLAHLLQLPLTLLWAKFWLPPSSVTTILFEHRTPRWAVPRCIGLGDISHLYAAGLQPKPRGILGNFT